MDSLKRKGTSTLDYADDEKSVAIAIGFEYRAESTDKLVISGPCEIDRPSHTVEKHIVATTTVRAKIQKPSPQLVALTFTLGTASFPIYV